MKQPAKVILITVKRKESSAPNATPDFMKKHGLSLDRETYLALNSQDENNAEEPIPDELED